MNTQTSVRLIIGQHEMNPFSGLSDGDRFGHINGKTYRVSNSSYGITLREDCAGLGSPLDGFTDLPDYHAFVRAVNQAALNA